MVAVAVFVSLLGLIFTTDPYFSYYPVIPWAVLTLDGSPTQGLAMYRHLSGRTIIVVRRGATARQIYFVNIRDHKAPEDGFRRGVVESCAESSIFVYKLVAVRNHEQICQSFLVLDGNKLDNQLEMIERKLIVAGKSVEFSADDGRRLRVSW